MFTYVTNEKVKNFDSALMSVFEKERTRIQFIKNLICVINRCSSWEKTYFFTAKVCPSQYGTKYSVHTQCKRVIIKQLATISSKGFFHYFTYISR